MSYSRSFRETLRSKDIDLFNRLIEIKKIARTLLVYTAGKFPYYTPHDFHHSEKCEENLCWLTSDKIREDLNHYELFFSILACWFHDWGLIGSPSEKPEIIRKEHHKRTENFFEKWYDKIRLNRNEARIVGRICRGHRKEDLTEELFEDVIFGSNIKIRVRLLTALVRIADECEIDSSRVTEVIYYTLNPIGQAKEEFERHLDTIGIGLSAKHKIRIQGIARDPKGSETLHKLGEKIQKEIDHVKVILSSYGIPLDQVEVKIDARGFIDKPISFSLDRKSITKLLIGEHLYSRKDVAIRELLQNSIDACKLRNELEKKYEPKIEINLQNNILEIKDNGFGMDYDRALSFLATKGHSFYKSEEFKKLGVKFEPISRFGLGILSCFLIASKIIIETKRSGTAPCEFTIEAVDRGWTYKRGSNEDIGTCIRLFLRENGQKIDVREALTHYLKTIEIPVELSINGKKEKFVPEWNINMKEVKEFIDEEASKNVIFYSLFEESTDDFDIVAFKTSEGYISEKIFLAIHGIYVGHFESSLFSSIRLGDSITILNLKKNLLELDISREKIVKNEMLKAFRIRLGKYYLKKLFQIFDPKGVKEGLPIFLSLSLNLILSVGSSVGKVKDLESFNVFFESMKYPVLVSNGLKFCILEEIKESGKTEIFDFTIYTFSAKELTMQIKCLEKIFKNKINSKSAIVFSSQLFLEDEKNDNITVVKAFCDHNKLRYCKLRIVDIINNFEFKKIDTPLDSLLPDGIYFGSREKCIKGLPIPLKFPKITFRGQYLAYKKIMEEDEILNVLRPFRSRRVKDAPYSLGEFLLDPEDAFLSKLIEHSKVILSNIRIKKDVSRYFRIIQMMLNLPSRGFFEDNFLLGWITTSEVSLINCLNIESDYLPLNQRVGPLWGIFLRELQRKVLDYD